MQGSTFAQKEAAGPTYLPSGDPGPNNGGTNTGSSLQPSIADYENFFGPAGRDVKIDPMRAKRRQRWHLPDNLIGVNHFLTDRVDGLITDTNNSPFTGIVLPYAYLENPDAKIKWSVYSYDEAMASRTPYETSARVLTQSKTSYAGFATRHGLAIKMEHNFMVSPEGIKNYYNQLKQLVGSIQYTNDYEVHVALIQAPSYARTVSEKFYYPDKNIRQVLRHYVDLYGIMQKTTNALDIVIEDAKQVMKQWGAANPDFLICNSKIGFQLNMTPERTQFITQGTDGLQRLRDGPEIDSYRGLRIINSRSFSLEAGMPPRDLLRRRVRVAEYYYIPYSDENKNRKYQFYDEGKDTFSTFSYDQLRKMAALGNETESPDKHDLLIIRPNIEHTMLGVIMGRGGLEQLGATYWGQTEMSCYDDSMFGVWGMSYKYHAKSIVYNEKNLIRVWDIAFDGYNGGGGCDNVTWIKDSDRQKKFLNATRNLGEPYDGPSMMVMGLPKADLNDLPSPLIFGDKDGTTKFLIDPEHVFTYGENNLDEHSLKTIYKAAYNTNATNEADKLRLNKYYDLMPNFGQLHTFRKPAGLATSSNVSQPPAMAFPGQMRVLDANGHLLQETSGSGHLGPSYVGVASVREGKGFKNTGMPTIQRII